MPPGFFGCHQKLKTLLLKFHFDMRHKQWIWVTALVCTAFSAHLFGQSSTASDRAPFLARVERARLGENVCVLVSPTGEYRLERQFPAKTEIFVGSLSPSELQKLERLLNADELRRLSQAQVPPALITETIDTVIVAISRPDGVQQLVFPDPDSRKPFRASTDSLLEWFNSIQKAEHPAIGEQGASHCMPARFTGPAEQSLAEASAAQASSFLMMIQRDRIADGVVERQCVVIYRNGQYRREKNSQRQGSVMKVQAVEGLLNSSQIAELRKILDFPALKNLQGKTPPMVLFQEGEFTRLVVPRSAAIQRLSFASYFGVPPSSREAGGLSNMRYGVNTDQRLLNPLREWLKKNVDKIKTNAISTSTGTGCLPLNTTQELRIDAGPKH
jgi:hypothetical protein